jgi:ketosteroid isomerase-like protein
MIVHPNAAVVRRLYEAFHTRDTATLSDLIADDAVWHVPGSTLISGDHRGKAAIFDYFRRMGELSGGTFHAELVDALASDTHAVAMATATGKRAGRTYDSGYLLLLRMEAGRIVDVRLFNDDAKAFEMFWS